MNIITNIDMYDYSSLKSVYDVDFKQVTEI